MCSEKERVPEGNVLLNVELPPNDRERRPIEAVTHIVFGEPNARSTTERRSSHSAVQRKKEHVVRVVVCISEREYDSLARTLRAEPSVARIAASSLAEQARKI